MRSLLSILAAAGLAVACSIPESGDAQGVAACEAHAERASHAADTGGWSIHAGPVGWTRDDPPRVSGRFEVCGPVSGAEPRVARRQGGACLVADLVDQGIGRAICATHADCNSRDAFDRGDPRLADFQGYCLAQGGSDEPPRCWTRPGPAAAFCKRTLDTFRMTAGVHHLGPVDRDPLNSGEPYPRWAVYACMAHAGHDRSCGEPASPHRQISLTPLEK